MNSWPLTTTLGGRRVARQFFITKWPPTMSSSSGNRLVSLPIRRWPSGLASHSGRARFLAYLLMNQRKCYRGTPKMKIFPKGKYGLSTTNVPLHRDNIECCWSCVSVRSVDEVLRTYMISTFVGSWLRSSLLFLNRKLFWDQWYTHTSKQSKTGMVSKITYRFFVS